MNILISVIPHDEQRYNTVGDWMCNRATGRLEIQVSDTGNWKYNSLIAVHELVEALVCLAHGVSAEQVDEFDLKFKGEGEPGDDPRAPYHLEHVYANGVEKSLAARLGVDWNHYGDVVDSLGGEYAEKRQEEGNAQEGQEGVLMAPKVESNKAQAIPGVVTAPKPTGKNDNIPGTNTSTKDVNQCGVVGSATFPPKG